jgi:hypothetical protein
MRERREKKKHCFLSLAPSLANRIHLISLSRTSTLTAHLVFSDFSIKKRKTGPIQANVEQVCGLGKDAIKVKTCDLKKFEPLGEPTYWDDQTAQEGDGWMSFFKKAPADPAPSPAPEKQPR